MENTNPTGSESLDVNQAASAFEGMMGDSEEADNSQAEGQPEDQQETDEVDACVREEEAAGGRTAVRGVADPRPAAQQPSGDSPRRSSSQALPSAGAPS